MIIREGAEPVNANSMAVLRAERAEEGGGGEAENPLDAMAAQREREMHAATTHDDVAAAWRV